MSYFPVASYFHMQFRHMWDWCCYLEFLKTAVTKLGYIDELQIIHQNAQNVIFPMILVWAQRNITKLIRRELLTSEFFPIVFLVSSSSSFCLHRWLFKIPSCRALALFSWESCLCVSSRSSSIYSNIIKLVNLEQNKISNTFLFHSSLHPYFLIILVRAVYHKIIEWPAYQFSMFANKCV